MNLSPKHLVAQGHVKFLKWPQGEFHTWQCQFGTLDFPPVLPFAVWSGWMDVDT